LRYAKLRGMVIRVKRTGKRMSVLVFSTLIFILSCIQPASAWSDVGVEYCDNIDDDPGTWYPTENQALEGGSFGSYDFQVIFRYDSIDQTADVYKLWIDFDGSDQNPPETLFVHYKWGTGSSWTYLVTFGDGSKEAQYTLTDATSSTLYVRFMDYSNFWDFLRDRWSFGGEPILWMYWY